MFWVMDMKAVTRDTKSPTDIRPCRTGVTKVRMTSTDMPMAMYAPRFMPMSHLLLVFRSSFLASLLSFR